MNESQYGEQMWQTALDLINRGYDVLPITWGEKSCFVTGWSTTTFTADWWAAAGSRGELYGVGVKCNNVVAVDIDCYDWELSVAMVQWVWDRYGLCPIRIGRWPKVLMVYRWTEDRYHAGRAARSPGGVESDVHRAVGLRKSISRKVVSVGTDAWGGCDDVELVHGLEILGMKQMFAAYSPYAVDFQSGVVSSWYDWGFTPHGVDAGGGLVGLDVGLLPTLCSEDAKAIIREWGVKVRTGPFKRRFKGVVGSKASVGGEWTAAAVSRREVLRGEHDVVKAAAVTGGVAWLDKLADKWVVDALGDMGLIRGVSEGGLKLEIVCPWSEEHSADGRGGELRGTLYQRCGPDEMGNEGFFWCLHSSCQGQSKASQRCGKAYVGLIPWLKSKGYGL